MLPHRGARASDQAVRSAMFDVRSVLLSRIRAASRDIAQDHTPRSGRLQGLGYPAAASIARSAYPIPLSHSRLHQHQIEPVDEQAVGCIGEEAVGAAGLIDDPRRVLAPVPEPVRLELDGAAVLDAVERAGCTCAPDRFLRLITCNWCAVLTADLFVWSPHGRTCISFVIQ